MAWRFSVPKINPAELFAPCSNTYGDISYVDSEELDSIAR